jgi:predicted ATPase
MSSPLNKITIKGFKSIKSLENFELKSVNLLIGANGAGKSNFIDFFRMMRAMMELPLPDLSSPSLQTYIADGGGSDDFLFNGPKITKQIEAELMFGDNGYRFKLAPTSDERFIINDEKQYFKQNSFEGILTLNNGTSTPLILELKEKKFYNYIYPTISSWKIYHFNDTSKFAPMRRSESIYDNDYLRFDASNIAPFLFDLKNREKDAYDRIIDTIRFAAPFFGDFIFKPNENEKIRLLWQHKGSDYPLKPNHLSDGTLRFICLATALLQPVLPSTIIIDEPELGLHPYAIEILAELIQSVSKKTQLIISTQSPVLVDCFEPEDVVVVNRDKGESIFKRLDKADLNLWLKDYSLGELWIKDIIKGTPSYE